MQQLSQGISPTRDTALISALSISRVMQVLLPVQGLKKQRLIRIHFPT